MRFTRSHTPVRLRADYPLAQVQPVPRHGYNNATPDRMDISAEPAGPTTEHCEAYQASIGGAEQQAEPAIRRLRDKCPQGSASMHARTGRVGRITVRSGLAPEFVQSAPRPTLSCQTGINRMQPARRPALNRNATS
jgi:hypothetical protein